MSNQPCMKFSHSNAGVSLIELMISVVIGMLLVIGATTVYVNSRKTADIDETVARLNETARYAMSVLEADTRMANYWGVNKDSNSIENKLGQKNVDTPIDNYIKSTKAADCGNSFAVDVQKYIEVYNNKYGLPCAANTKEMESADTLIIRRAAGTTSAPNATQLQVCSNRNSTMIIKAASCDKDDLRNLVVNAYYVDQASDQNAAYPALRRKALSAGPDFDEQEIIPGIEDMQVQLGLDTTGISGRAFKFVDPDDAAVATSNVVAVRIWLLVRAEQPDLTYTDTRTYVYGDRDPAKTTNDISKAAAAKVAYKPSDNFRRVLVSRTFFIRNVTGT